MKSRIFRKIAALVIVLTMVLSLAGVALAAPKDSNKQTSIHVFVTSNTTITSVQVMFKGTLLTLSEQGGKWTVKDDGEYVSDDITQVIVNGQSASFVLGVEGNGTINIRADYNLPTATHYSLTYQIISSVAGQPAAPASYSGYSEPTLTAVTPFDGYNFIGWSQLIWTTAGTETVLVNNVLTIVTYKTATVAGYYSQQAPILSDTKLYNLQYLGYTSGMLFWPENVLESAVQPTIAGAPYLLGYDFLGWTPATLDWNGATVAYYIYNVVTPQDGSPYIEQIPVYSITVTGTFNQEIPLNPPEEEIPLGSPATGDANWLVFAGIILLAGAALGGYTLVRRKDS